MITSAIVFLISSIFAGVTVGLFRRLAIRHSIIDRSNERSLHRGDKPRGGGIAIVLSVMLVQLVSVTIVPVAVTSVLIWGFCTGGIAVLGFFDDIFSLGTRVRLITQTILATAFVYCAIAAPELTVGQTMWLLPLFILTAILFVVWTVNACNFMDGADGLLTSQALIIGITLAFSSRETAVVSYVYVSVALAGGALGFLYWNWAPSKIFLGDVGSYFIGFHLAAFVLLAPSYELSPFPGLILLAPLLTDATMTLLRRILAAEPWWRAHHSHVYQLAVRAGFTHRQVVSMMGMISVTLFAPFAVVAGQKHSAGMLLTVVAYVCSILLWIVLYRKLAYRAQDGA